MSDLVYVGVLTPVATDRPWAAARQRLGESIVRTMADTTLAWPDGTEVDAARVRSSASAAISELGAVRANEVVCTVLQADCLGQAVTHGSACTLGGIAMLIRDVARVDDMGQFVLTLERT